MGEDKRKITKECKKDKRQRKIPAGEVNPYGSENSGQFDDDESRERSEEECGKAEKKRKKKKKAKKKKKKASRSKSSREESDEYPDEVFDYDQCVGESSEDDMC